MMRSLLFVFLFACAGGSSAGLPSEPQQDSKQPEAETPAPSGSSSSSSPTTPRVTLTAPFSCPTDGIQGEPQFEATVIERLRTQAGLDFLEFRYVMQPNQAPKAKATAGTACNDCTSPLAALTSSEKLYSSSYEVDFMVSGAASSPGYYLAYSKGDAVGKISNLAELKTLIPNADTVEKAMLFAHLGGFRVECQKKTWAAQSNAGWTFVATKHVSRCERNDAVIVVSSDGTVTTQSISEAVNDPCT